MTVNPVWKDINLNNLNPTSQSVDPYRDLPVTSYLMYIYRTQEEMGNQKLYWLCLFNLTKKTKKKLD